MLILVYSYILTVILYLKLDKAGDPWVHVKQVYYYVLFGNIDITAFDLKFSFIPVIIGLKGL